MSYNKLKNIIHSNILINNIYKNCDYVAPFITVFNPELTFDYFYNNIKIDYTNKLIEYILGFNRLDKFINDINNINKNVNLDKNHIIMNIDTDDITLDPISQDIHNNIEYNTFKELIINKYIDEHYHVTKEYNNLIIKEYMKEKDNIKDICTIAVIYEHIQNNNPKLLYNDIYKLENYLQSKYNREYKFENIDNIRLNYLERYFIESNKNKYKNYVTDDIINDIIQKYIN